LNDAGTANHVGVSQITSSGIAPIIFSLSFGLFLITLGAAFVGVLCGASVDTIAGLIAGFLFLVTLLWVARNAGPRLTYGLFLLYFALLIGWTLTVSSQQISDFGVYFRCGAEDWKTAGAIQEWMQKCHSAWLPGFSPYWRRSLLYTLPIGILGNGSYLVLKLCNSALHLGAVAAIYRLVADRVTRSQGIVAAAALAIYPEYWFTTSLATSDNLAILLIILWLHAVLRCVDEEPAFGQVVYAAFIALGLDLLRDIGLICALATVLLAMASASRVRWRMLAASALTFGLMTLAAWIGAHWSPPPAQQAGLFARLVGNSITTTYPWMDVYRWFEYVYPLVPAQYHGRYLIGLLAMDLDHGVVAALSNWMAKINVLFQGFGYYMFSASTLDANPDNYRIGDFAPTYVSHNGFALFLTGASAAFTIFALFGAIKRHSDDLNRVSIVFCAAFLFFVVGFGESQARYCVLLSPAFCILIAGMLSSRTRTLTECARHSVGAVLMFVGVLCAGFFIVERTADLMSANHPLMRSFEQEKAATIDGATCNLISVPVEIRARYVFIPLPSARPACYSFVFSVQGEHGKLHYYAARDPVLPRSEIPPPSAVSVKVVPADGDQAQATSNAMGRNEAFTSEALAPDRRVNAFRLILKVGDSADHRAHDIAFGFFHDDRGDTIKLTP
jgi:hypothetical protein